VKPAYSDIKISPLQKRHVKKAEIRQDTCSSCLPLYSEKHPDRCQANPSRANAITKGNAAIAFIGLMKALEAVTAFSSSNYGAYPSFPLRLVSPRPWPPRKCITYLENVLGELGSCFFLCHLKRKADANLIRPLSFLCSASI